MSSPDAQTLEHRLKDADTFFGIEVPAVGAWTFSPEQAAEIQCPVLSMLGADTEPLWVEVAEFLRSSLPTSASSSDGSST